MDKQTVTRPRESMAETKRTGFRWSSYAYLAGVVGLAALLLFTPAPTARLGIGGTSGLAGGAVARLNGVESSVTLDSGLPGPEAGMRLDRIDVEICAGSGELFVDSAFWNGLGDDQRVHSAHMSVRSFFTLTMAPGSCQRGSVELAVPEGVDPDAVLLMDTSRTTVARWAVEGPAGDPEPLASAVRADAVAPGSRVELVVGGSAAVHAVDLDAQSSVGGANPAGGGLARVDAELCAGGQPIPASPRHWFLRLTDHRLVAAHPEGSTMPAAALDAGACSRGTIDFPIPAGALPAGVLYAYGGQFELARWAINQ